LLALVRLLPPTRDDEGVGLVGVPPNTLECLKLQLQLRLELAFVVFRVCLECGNLTRVCFDQLLSPVVCMPGIVLRLLMAFFL
jgi:hypothetical protein